MKKMKIQVHTTTTEPEITPFSMIYSSVWESYDRGELNKEKLLLFSILYRKVNAFNGVGQTSYWELCVHLKRKPNQQNINIVNKLMTELRDVHELIWFPEHSGVREFSYLVADFKLAKKPNETIQKWVDIKPYFQSQKQSDSRPTTPSIATIQPEAQPRWKPPEQGSERSNSGGISHISESLGKYQIRPPQTNNDNQK